MNERKSAVVSEGNGNAATRSRIVALSTPGNTVSVSDKTVSGSGGEIVGGDITILRLS